MAIRRSSAIAIVSGALFVAGSIALVRPVGHGSAPKTLTAALSSTDIVGGIVETSFTSAESDLGWPILRPSDCVANDGSATEIMINAKNGEVFLRYAQVDDPSCSGYVGGSLIVNEWLNDGPSDSASLQKEMAARASAMGPSAELSSINGVPVILITGDYSGDCGKSPAPGQEGCAPAQSNPTGVIVQAGSTMIELMGSGTWSTAQLEAVAATIAGLGA